MGMENEKLIPEGGGKVGINLSFAMLTIPPQKKTKNAYFILNSNKIIIIH